MTDQLMNAIASGGAMSVIFAFAVGFLWKWFTKRETKREEYWTKEVQRVRSTGQEIISQKDSIIERKDEMLLEQAKDYESKLMSVAKDYDTRIGSIVKTYDAKIKDKDDQLTDFRNEMQSILVTDAELRTRQIDSIVNLTNALKNN